MRRWILMVAAIGALFAQNMGVVSTMTIYGITEQDIHTAINASKDGDREALAGMMKRGRIKPLMKGTKVQIYGKGTHATRIRIASGEDIDIRGWMPTIHVR